MTDHLSNDATIQPRDRAVIDRVLSLIRLHVGSSDPISLERIAELTGISTRSIQSIVKFVVEEEAEPIGTNTKEPFGYYVIESDVELRKNYGHFLRRGLSNLKHARAYNKQSIVGPIVGQLELEATDTERKQ
jgi:hypothetical protein